jgi:hypothetical protein
MIWARAQDQAAFGGDGRMMRRLSVTVACNSTNVCWGVALNITADDFHP